VEKLDFCPASVEPDGKILRNTILESKQKWFRYIHLGFIIVFQIVL